MEINTHDNKLQKITAEEKKAAQALGKEHPDYNPIVYYGDLLWTRLMARSLGVENPPQTFLLGPDIAQDKKKTKFKVKDRVKLGKELYNPESYEPEKLPLKVE